jgi:hypothetical protein
MTPQIKEHMCTACSGTGFPEVKQPMLATRKIYPVKCAKSVQAKEELRTRPTGSLLVS